MPDGKMTEEKTEKTHNKIDLKRPVIILFIKAKEDKIFQLKKEGSYCYGK